jgi:signal transduction histidine kinase
VADDAAAADRIQRLGLAVGPAWALAAAAVAAARLARASPSRRRASWPMYAAGCTYLVLVAGVFVAWLEDGFLEQLTTERRLWLAEAAALIGVALAVGWAASRTRHARSAVARLVVDLARSTPAGGLREVLARAVGDTGLTLAYPIEPSGRLVDAGGHPVKLADGRARTTLVRDGRPVAVLAHAPGALDDTDLVDEVTRAARLGLEHERLHAQVRARLLELRASRARIVAAGDAERRRLERDLHDGAQQRLLGLSLSLRLLRSQLPAGTDAATLARLDDAARELTDATRELRELAHGVFPAVLAQEGLAAAVEALAEDGRVPFAIDGVPEERFPADVETAAYTVIAEASRTASDRVAVRAERGDSTLVVEVETQAGPPDPVELEDRVGAVDGRLTVQRNVDGRVTIRAEFPCVS